MGLQETSEDDLAQLALYLVDIMYPKAKEDVSIGLMDAGRNLSHRPFLARNDPQLLEIIVLLKKITSWQTVIQLLLCTVSLIGNGMICLSSRYLRRPISLYVLLCVSLAAIDIFASLTFVIDLLEKNFFRSPVEQQSNESLCISYTISLFRISATISSSWHLLALAVYQYFGIMWPLKTKIYFRRKHFRVLFIFLWVTPLIILFTKYTIIPNDGLLSKKCSCHFRERFLHRIFVAALIFVPLILTISLYIRIVCFLRGSYSLIKAKNWAQVTENTVENFPKLVNTAVVIVVSFILSYGIHSLYSPLVCKEGCPFSPQGKHMWIIWFGLLQSDLVVLKFVANPFIYTLRMSCFRESLSSMSHNFSDVFTRKLPRLQRIRTYSFRQMPKHETMGMEQL